jgi:hypothetical protein
VIKERGMPGDVETKDDHLTMEVTEDDEVFHWGREVDVQWGMLTWVTFRDQVCLFLVV